jgi:uncharacterized protein YciI
MYVADPRQVPSTIFMYTLYPTRLEMFTSGPTDAERSSAAEHWIYSQQLLRKGVVVFSGRAIERTSEGAFAIVVIRADSEDDARALMNADPAVRSGIFRARLFPFQPMLMGEWPAEAATAIPA